MVGLKDNAAILFQSNKYVSSQSGAHEQDMSKLDFGLLKVKPSLPNKLTS